MNLKDFITLQKYRNPQIQEICWCEALVRVLALTHPTVILGIMQPFYCGVEIRKLCIGDR